EQMAVLMIRWLEQKEDLSGLDTSKVADAILDFVMVGAYAEGGKKEIREEYQSAVKKAYVLGLLTGYEDTSFRPQGILIRAEAATVVVRMLEAKRRVPFQPEVMIEKQQAEKAQYYYGGSKWLDPADAKISKLERGKVDRILTTGALSYNPYLHNLVEGDQFIPDLSVDEVNTLIKYGRPENPYQAQLADLEQLLLRRVSRADTEKVIQFLSRKTSPATNLEVAGIGFMLRNDEYLVQIRENTDLEDIAYSVMVNIIYRDDKWKSLEKLYIQEIPIRH
ncbi:S-layer homology domain-containing protein, partial [Clostridiales bacterium COT073_COT-073]